MFTVLDAALILIGGVMLIYCIVQPWPNILLAISAIAAAYGVNKLRRYIEGRWLGGFEKERQQKLDVERRLIHCDYPEHILEAAKLNAEHPEALSLKFISYQVDLKTKKRTVLIISDNFTAAWKEIFPKCTKDSIKNFTFIITGLAYTGDEPGYASLHEGWRREEYVLYENFGSCLHPRLL